MNTSPRATDKVKIYLVRYRNEYRLATSQETAELSSPKGCEIYSWVGELGDMLDAGRIERVDTTDVDRYRKGLI